MSENLKFYKGLEKNLPPIYNEETKVLEVPVEVGALYHCTDTNNTYIGTSTTKLELWSSGTSFQQLNDDESIGGVVIGEGDAIGKASIAGGSSDDTILNEIVGINVNVIGSYSPGSINNALGEGGTRLLLADQEAKSQGASSISYGAGSNSVSSASIATGIGAYAGSKGFFIKSITYTSDSLLTIQMGSNRDSTDYQYTYDKTTKTLSSDDIVAWNSSCANIIKQPEKILGMYMVNSHDSTWAPKRKAKNDALDTSKEVLGDWVTIILNDAFYLCGRIVSITPSTGVLTISNDKNLFTEKILSDNIGTASTTSPMAPYAYTISVPQKPEIGSHEIHFAGMAHGVGSIAAGTLSSAFGMMNKAVGVGSFVTGRENIGGFAALVGGYKNTVTGADGFSSGRENIISASHSGAVGAYNQVLGESSFAEGKSNIVTGSEAHAEGGSTRAAGKKSHAEGVQTAAFGAGAHTEGYSSKKAPENKDDVEDAWFTATNFTAALGIGSHAEGKDTLAIGNYSHAEGEMSWTIGKNSHVEGYSSVAEGEASHAEGGACGALGSFSHAEGNLTEAIGTCSHAEGYYTVANDNYSHAEGYCAKADKPYSHAEGSNSEALNEMAHAEGETTYAEGYASHSEGSGTKAAKTASHAEGCLSEAQGDYSHAEGYHTIANGNQSHTEGYCTTTTYSQAHAEGYQTTAAGYSSHAEGKSDSIAKDACEGAITHQAWIDSGRSFTIAIGTGSHTEGGNTFTKGDYAHAEGYRTYAESYASHAEGGASSALNNYAHAEGEGSTASGHSAHAEGGSSKASGNKSHAEGYGTLAAGAASHAEGYTTRAYGLYSHVEGHNNESQFLTITGGASVKVYTVKYYNEYILPGIKVIYQNVTATVTKIDRDNNTITLDKTLSTSALSEVEVECHTFGSFGTSSHSEGTDTYAAKENDHAEGHGTVACGGDSHAEGHYTYAGGSSSHAEGYRTNASGRSSHAEGEEGGSTGTGSHSEGLFSCASGDYSHAEGIGTIASAEAQHVQGKWSDEDNSKVHIIGWGSNEDDRKNIHTVDINGNAWYNGSINTQKLILTDNFGNADLTTRSGVVGEIYFKLVDEE